MDDDNIHLRKIFSSGTGAPSPLYVAEDGTSYNLVNVLEESKKYVGLWSKNSPNGLLIPCINVVYYPSKEKPLQTFYEGENVILKVDHQTGDFNLITQNQIELVRLFINKKIVTIGTQPRQDNEFALEKASRFDRIWYDLSVIKADVAKKVFDLVRPHFENCLEGRLKADNLKTQNWQTCLTFEYGGIGLGQLLTSYYQEKLKGQNGGSEDKRLVIVRKEAFEKGCLDKTTVDKDFKSGDIILMKDDAAGTALGFLMAYNSLLNDDFLRDMEVKELVPAYVYVVLDIERRQNGEKCFEVLPKKCRENVQNKIKELTRLLENSNEPIEADRLKTLTRKIEFLKTLPELMYASFIKTGDIMDIIYVKGNKLLDEANKNKNDYINSDRVIYRTKKWYEEEFKNKDNFNEKDKYIPHDPNQASLESFVDEKD